MQCASTLCRSQNLYVSVARSSCRFISLLRERVAPGRLYLDHSVRSHRATFTLFMKKLRGIARLDECVAVGLFTAAVFYFYFFSDRLNSSQTRG